MADAGDDVFLLGDDFEAILDLDEDEALQKQFSSVAGEESAKYINIHPYLPYLIFRVADAALI